MASKGQRSKLDHETRNKRQKALEPPKEPRRPKTHWDHVLEEMVWLSKDFESERKWKLALAKKVAIRASKGMVDQATRGERKVKEEEHRLRKVALNISKDVKKFWTKIEKLVIYKHQLEVGEKKKKAQNKQLEFLLGQTERYSTMLAENLVASPIPYGPERAHLTQEHLSIQCEEQRQSDATQYNMSNIESRSDVADDDKDYDAPSEVPSEDDDEHTIEEDEALITIEERQEELAALNNEIDLPIEEILKRYGVGKASSRDSPEKTLDATTSTQSRGGDGKTEEKNIQIESTSESGRTHAVSGGRCDESNGRLSVSENHSMESEASEVRKSIASVQELRENHTAYDFSDEQEDGDFVLANGDEKDDETTLSEEECIANTESYNAVDEIALLQQEIEIPVEELLARYKKMRSTDDEMVDDSGSEYVSGTEDLSDASAGQTTNVNMIRGLVEEDAELDEQNLVVSPVSREQTAEPDHNCDDARENESRIADAAAAARSAQPTGNTFLTTKVRTKHPFLLKFALREYQHIGLDWLVTLYEKRLNGILADEMGLGKTIMTIALLAHLACEKGIWGPHLIVVPTSVMLNWETEFLKWCPAFKILTYFGCAKERKIKRQGWLKPNSFHVCITTYRLVIQDSKVFKRKKWKYLILDEAHLIKNWKSQRWQTLLNFNTKRRILLTGTPLQNDLMELWSLMHFLMPHIFQSHQEFKEWFSNPISGMVDGQEKVNKEVVDRLHNVLRPFILRRLKRDVEKQLPMKHEHVIYCRLSRRQRNLYEDYIASSETQATLASSNFFGMISVIMQLRKVCNHPDLFEGRPIVSSFDMNAIETQLSSSVCSIFTPSPFSEVDLYGLGFVFTHLDFCMNSWESDEVQAIATPSSLIEGRTSLGNVEEITFGSKHRKMQHGVNIFEEIQQALLEERLKEAKERAIAISWWNSLRCKKKPIYSTSLRELVTIRNSVYNIHKTEGNMLSYLKSSMLANIILSPVERFHKMVNQVESFMFAIPAARAPPPICWCSKTRNSHIMQPGFKEICTELLSPLLTPFRPAIVRRQVYFPDRRLIQFDCGKLQELSVLLRRLKSEGHRALIFTQMTKMLDVLEAFISLYGYTYMRLDGSTQPEERQTLMQRFNTNSKYFLFILSTRSGGVGVNLVGADTVIFYDSDWNPAMSARSSADKFASSIANELLMIVRKQVSNPDLKYKKMGLIGTMKIVSFLADVNSSPNLSSSQKTNTDEALELLIVSLDSCKQLPLPSILFYDELIAMLNQKHLHREIMEWIGKHVGEFELRFLSDLEGGNLSAKESYCDLEGELWMNLDGDISPICLNILPLVSSSMRSASLLQILPAHFLLLSTIERLANQGSLGGIDALLGCPLHLPSSKFFSGCAWKSLSDKQKQVLCLCLYYAANWMRELINAFCTQVAGRIDCVSQEMEKEIVGKLLKRLRDLVYLESLLNAFLKKYPVALPELYPHGQPAFISFPCRPTAKILAGKNTENKPRDENTSQNNKRKNRKTSKATTNSDTNSKSRQPTIMDVLKKAGVLPSVSNENTSETSFPGTTSESNEQVNTHEPEYIEVSAVPNCLEVYKCKFRPLLVQCFSILSFSQNLDPCCADPAAELPLHLYLLRDLNCKLEYFSLTEKHVSSRCLRSPPGLSGMTVIQFLKNIRTLFPTFRRHLNCAICVLKEGDEVCQVHWKVQSGLAGIPDISNMVASKSSVSSSVFIEILHCYSKMLNLPDIFLEKMLLSDLLESLQPIEVPDCTFSGINLIPSSGSIDYLYLGAYSFLSEALDVACSLSFTLSSEVLLTMNSVTASVQKYLTKSQEEVGNGIHVETTKELLSTLHIKLGISAQKLLSHDWNADTDENCWKRKGELIQRTVHIYLENCESTADLLNELAQSVLPKVSSCKTTSKDDSHGFPTLCSATFVVWYKELHEENLSILNKLVKEVVIVHKSRVNVQEEPIGKLITNLRKSVDVVVSLINLCRTHNKVTVHALAIKYGGKFIDSFLKVFDFLQTQIDKHNEPIVELVKELQKATRTIQTLCSEAKSLKQTAIASKIPATKRSLERFLFQVKALIHSAASGCDFWMGNLKHKDLTGQIVSSQAYMDQDENIDTDFADIVPDDEHTDVASEEDKETELEK